MESLDIVHGHSSLHSAFNVTGTYTTENISQRPHESGNYGNGTEFRTSDTFVGSKDFLFYSLGIIIPTGLICNTISFMVLISRRMRSKPMCYYLATLAMSDNVSLGTILLDYWLKDPRIGADLVKTNTVVCVVVSQLSLASRLLSALLVTSLTIERFRGVVYPFQKNATNDARYAKLTVLSEIVLSVAVSSFTPFTIGIVVTPYGIECDVKPQVAETYLICTMIFLVFGSIVIPVIVISVLNAYMFYTIYQVDCLIENKEHLVVKTRNSSISSMKDNSQFAARILLVLSTTFVILNTPYCICWLTFFVQHHILRRDVTGFYAAKYITSVPYYLNYGVNFILYSLTGKTFREELVRMLSRPCRRPAERKISKTTRGTNLICLHDLRITGSSLTSSN